MSDTNTSTSTTQEKKDTHSKNIKTNTSSKPGEVNVDDIAQSPYQPRLNIKTSELKKLSDSISEKGLIQPVPIIRDINKESGKKYILLAGHRRLAAYKLLNKKKIQVTLFNNLDKADMAAYALIENLQREDLDLIEVSLQFNELLRAKHFKNAKELAKALGKSETEVSKLRAVLKLPDGIIEDIKKHKTIKDIKIIDALRRLKDEKLITEYYHWYVRESPTREVFVAKVKEYLASGEDTKVNKVNNDFSEKFTYLIKQDFSSLNSDAREEVEYMIDEITSIINKNKNT
jgi:ParB/RepB/Spo0J family partition protein